MTNILGILTSGLKATQTAMNVVSNNIANVNTPGFSRRTAHLEEAISSSAFNYNIGSGVNVASVQRDYDSFVAARLRSNTSSQHNYETFYNNAKFVEDLLSENGLSLSNSMSSFFNSLNTLLGEPNSNPTRQVFLSEAEIMAAQFNTVYSELNSILNGIENQISTTVSTINNLTEQIVDLNTQVSGGSSDSNDLLDRRDYLIDQLSEHIGLKTVEQDDGSINLFLNNGTSLVIGGLQSNMYVESHSVDPQKLELGIGLSASSTSDITEANLSGKLSGLLDTQDLIYETINEIGRIAIAIAGEINTQHQIGRDQDGDTGNLLFSDINSSSLQSSRVLSNASGTLDLSISIDTANIDQLTADNYLVTYNGSSYTVTNQTTGSTTSAADVAAVSAAIPGVTITSSGSPAAGDSFLIKPTATGAADLGLAITSAADIALAAPAKAAANTSNTGTGQITIDSIASAYADTSFNIDFQYDTVGGSMQYRVDGGSWTDYTDGNSITATHEGITFTLSGQFNPGDQFSVSPTSNDSSDNNNGLLMAAISEANVIGSGTLNEAYTSHVADIATQMSQADTNGTVSKSLVNQLTEQKNSISGVNLDEEATYLLKHQHAYQAISIALNKAQEAFDALISILR